jgi:hypothetical protein
MTQADIGPHQTYFILRQLQRLPGVESGQIHCRILILGEVNMERTAKCLCGQFSVITTGEPIMVNVCHCHDCQKRSGAPWTSNAYFPKENVRLEGPNKVYTRTSNAGNQINHHFCLNCGVTVCFTRAVESIRFGIPVGTFNDPSFPAPSKSFWEDRRYAWSPQISGVEHWSTQPPPP